MLSHNSSSAKFRLRGVAVFATVIGTAASLVCTGSLHLAAVRADLLRQPDRSSSPVVLRAIRMVTPGFGWGVSASALLFTSDGGRQWKVIKALASETQDARYELSAFKFEARAAVGSLGSGTGVLSTNNGGRTVHAVHVAPALAGMDFVDPRHGWLVTTSGAAAGQGVNEVFRSWDGGRQWHQVARTSAAGSAGPVPGCDECLAGISFRTRRVGWLTGSSPSIGGFIFYRTWTGGRHWFRQSLPLPLGYKVTPNMATGSPIFFGNRGVLPAYLSSPPALVIYVTRDGGTQWFPTKPIPTRAGTRSLPRTDAFAIGPSRIWAWVHSTLYRTDNGGRQWGVLTRGLPLGQQPEIQFVRDRIGFAVPTAPGRPFILTTNNGGRLWHRIATTLAS